MTKHRDLKLLIRGRMEKTGESYAAARRHVVESSSKEKAPPPHYGPPTPAHNHIKGWRGGVYTPDYEIVVDRTQGYRAPQSALIRSLSDDAVTSSTPLMQAFLADHYRGRRITLSGWIKSEDLTGSCRLWMRIFENQRVLLFAESVAVTGTAAWTRRDVALEIDQQATMILIGITLDGAGAAWLADVELEHGTKHVPADDGGFLPFAPRNLSFVD